MVGVLRLLCAELGVVGQGRLHPVGGHGLQPLLLKVIQAVLEGRHLSGESVDRLIKVENWIISLGAFDLV